MSDHNYSSNDEDYDPTAAFEEAKEESQTKLYEEVKQKSVIPRDVQLFADYEDKTEEALKLFVNLEETVYANKQIGDSGQNGEYMACVCSEDVEDGINSACFDDDCINRGTKIECVNGYSSCGDDCANQRFQKKQYASINVIKTAKKGYGVRIQEEVEPDSLIFEYIGEVIDEKTFKKRMHSYDQEGIKHFYFMMLQKGEFIDATKKGSLGRLLNHSCNPNCYVEKWVVGDKLKMGIFSKRKIISNEELTFNYNVDTYGAKSQVCYCGETNCAGFIGGKTQTDSAILLPQHLAQVLGSTPEEEQGFITAMEKQKVKLEKNSNNINVEYVKSLVAKPIEKSEVNAVIGALRQNIDYFVVDRLLERIEVTKAEYVREKLSWTTHGVFGKLIRGYIEKDDGDEINEIKTVLITRILKLMKDWPEVSRDSIEKSNVIAVIEQLEAVDFNEELTQLSHDLLERWDTFKYNVTIKKSSAPRNLVLDDRRRERNQQSASVSVSASATPTRSTPTAPSSHYSFIKGVEYSSKEEAERDLHPDWSAAFDENAGKYYFYNSITHESNWNKFGKAAANLNNSNSNNNNSYNSNNKYNNNNSYTEFTEEEKEAYRLKKQEEERKRKEYDLLNKKKKDASALQDLIKRATEADLRKNEEEVKKAKAIEEARRKKKEQYKKKMKAKQQAKANKASSQSDPIETLEKQWKIFFAHHVPNMLKSYMEEVGKDNIKICAKDIIGQLVSKELKKGQAPPSALKKEKYTKIKGFVSIHMEKFLIKFRDRKKRKFEDNSKSTENDKKQHS